MQQCTLGTSFFAPHLSENSNVDTTSILFSQCKRTGRSSCEPWDAAVFFRQLVTDLLGFV